MEQKASSGGTPAGEDDREEIRLLRKQLFYMRIQTAAGLLLTFVLLAAVLRLLPGAVRVLDQANAVLADARTAIADLDEVSENVNELVNSGSEAVGQTMEKIEQMDIEQLNDAIADLNRVIEPLAEFFGRFQ